jgi:hypothetical protein
MFFHIVQEGIGFLYSALYILMPYYEHD